LRAPPSDRRLCGANLDEITRPKIISTSATIRMMDRTLQPEPLLGGLGGLEMAAMTGGAPADSGGGGAGGR
jgi:hypothetical protein